MAVQLILVQFVEVRILVGQQETPRDSEGFCFSRKREELALLSGRGKQNHSGEAGMGSLV